MQGDPFFLQLDLVGNPLPLGDDVNWFVNGRPLALMPGIDYGADFIRIDLVTRLDEGEYLVNASNTAGVGSATFQLNVDSEWQNNYS